VLALWMLGRRRRKRPLAPRRVKLTWAAVILGGVLQVDGAIHGVAPPWIGYLLIWMLLPVGIPYWMHIRIRPVVPVDNDSRVAVWNELVACPNGALPDSKLTEVAEVTRGKGRDKKVIGWKGLVRLPLGRSTVDNAITATPRVASAFETAATSI